MVPGAGRSAGAVGRFVTGGSRVWALWGVVNYWASVYHGMEISCQFLSLSVTRPAFVPAGRVFSCLSLFPLTEAVIRSPLRPPRSLSVGRFRKGPPRNPALPPRCLCAAVPPGRSQRAFPFLFPRSRSAPCLVSFRCSLWLVSGGRLSLVRHSSLCGLRAPACAKVGRRGAPPSLPLSDMEICPSPLLRM